MKKTAEGLKNEMRQMVEGLRGKFRRLLAENDQLPMDLKIPRQVNTSSSLKGNSTFFFDRILFSMKIFVIIFKKNCKIKSIYPFEN